MPRTKVEIRDRQSELQDSNAIESEPRVAVVVPSYNHATFVALTLRSIFRQTLAPAVLVVIDDGSTDCSPQIIERVLN